MSDSKEIGKMIKEARRSLKMSQTDLANRLGKTLRTVQKYESGEIEPSIAMINEIAKILCVSPAELSGYHKQNVEINNLSDVFNIINLLNNKLGIRFDIDVNRPPYSEEWSCSLRFSGNENVAKYNSSVCLFLERYAEERTKLETYWTDQDYFDHWMEKELAYYANTALEEKKPEEISNEERMKRRNELLEKQISENKKAADEGSEN